MSENKKKFVKRRTRKKPSDQIEIAKERIEILFGRADIEFPEHPELSDRYVEIARRISMKYNVPIHQVFKKRFCKKCKKYLVYGANCRVRLDSQKKCIIITCLECNNKMMYGYARPKE
ncbi:MAG: ribonuclease P [archaeon]